jgi:hypothetical protein
VLAAVNHLGHLVVLAFGLAVASVVWIRGKRRSEGRDAFGGSPSGGRLGQANPSKAVGLAQCASLSALVGAGVHAVVMPAHYRESLEYGLFFTLAVGFQISFAVALLVMPSRRVALAGAAGSAALIAVWLLTRFVEIPLGPASGHTEPVGPLDLLATLSECATFIYCSLLLATRLPSPSWRLRMWSWGRRGVAVGLAGLVAVVAASYPVR